jgi:transposase InsO family protein
MSREVTRDSGPNPIARGQLAQRFVVRAVTIIQVWVDDVTYIPIREGFRSLSTVLDLSLRCCAGWATSDTSEIHLATSSLRMAREARQRAPRLIFHCDRGSQYSLASYRTTLTARCTLARMRGKGFFADAVEESFVAKVEFEESTRSGWRTRKEARRTIFPNLEMWKNRKRRHSTLGDVNTTEHEMQQRQTASLQS